MNALATNAPTPLLASFTGDAPRDFLAFTVATESYALDILTVREIRGWTAENPLPNCPAHVRGVINLRGEVVPIYDLRLRLGATATPPTPSHVVIVIAAAAGTYGLLVDTVSDILSLAPGDLQPVPQTGLGSDHAFLAALATRGEQMVSILDPDRLLGAAAVETIAA
ncbi:chemotaxis protein CheW [Ferrovibrio sp.]|uniref:chemotaxis protein CheW n=1 Tax=Ferrovibrio sp. TaxID=1917215 RepID=UPI003D28174A